MPSDESRTMIIIILDCLAGSMARIAPGMSSATTSAARIHRNVEFSKPDMEVTMMAVLNAKETAPAVAKTRGRAAEG
jgi:hypothetical protein